MKRHDERWLSLQIAIEELTSKSEILFIDLD